MKTSKDKHVIFAPDKVNYILRYYLPHWDLEQRVGEIIEFSRKTGTKHLMLMCEHQHINWNMIPIELAQRQSEALLKAREQFDKHGIHFGLNMGVTFGHGMNRWDHRERFSNIHYWTTDINGHTNYSSPCPLDPNLKRHVLEVYKLYTRCQPDYIYIDDDLRYNIANNWWGCMCLAHLRQFSELTGRSWDLEKLKLKLYCEPGIRKLWIEMLGKSIVDWAADITKAVHEVDHSIAMGMMVPCVHLLPLFGHNLQNVLEGISDGVTPLVRPPIGAYSDTNKRDIVGGLFYMELTAHCLRGHEVDYTPELETTPFTRLAKSMTVVRFQIAQSLLNDMANPAITVAGYAGDHINLEPAYQETLSAQRPFFQSLLKYAPTGGSRKGIQLVYDFDSAKNSQRTIKHPSDLVWPVFSIASVLGSSGICYTFDDSEIKFLAGDVVWTMPDSEIVRILGQGLILDVVAAETLIKRGYGQMIGVEVDSEGQGWMAEICSDHDFFGPYTNTYIPLKNAMCVYRIGATKSSRVISQVVDADRKPLFPAVVLYENSNGGKIATLAYPVDAYDSDNRHLLCYHRIYMLRKIIAWMNTSSLPIFVENPTDFLVQCWDDGEIITVCLTNLSHDSCNHFRICVMHRKLPDPARAVFIDDDGELKPLKVLSINSDGDNHVWEIEHACYAFMPLVIRIPLSK
jgi:hypothetical protein